MGRNDAAPSAAWHGPFALIFLLIACLYWIVQRPHDASDPTRADFKIDNSLILVSTISLAQSSATDSRSDYKMARNLEKTFD